MRSLSFLFAAVFLTLAACVPTSQTQKAFQGGYENLGRAALPSFNTARGRNGLSSFRINAKLTRAARAHASDMYRRSYFGHKSVDGSTVKARVLKQDYDFCYVSENIAQGQDSLEKAVRAWMQSPSHRRNVLNPRATEYGLVRGPNDNWVMVLASPRVITGRRSNC